jgi:hypothetical protein
LVISSLVLIDSYRRVLILLPISLVVGYILSRIWFDVSTPAFLHRFNAFLHCWQYLGSLVITLGWTLFWVLLPVLIRGHFPLPLSHDEFSSILGGETFAAGRLTNSTPACWEHFETYHTSMTPTYHTKYQPGMSIVFALGIFLCDQPFVGMIIVLLLASAALTWMLHLWLPVRWALPMTLLASMILVLNWGGNYFAAGPLATIAGALQIGLFRRWSMSPHQTVRRWDGVLWGLSLVLLAWSRPFEGLVFSIIMGIGLLITVIQRKNVAFCLSRLLPGLVLTVLPAGWFQLEYNQAATGSRTLFPYVHHYQQYGISPPFFFQSRLAEPVYRHHEMRQMHRQEAAFDQQLRSIRWLPSFVGFRFGKLWANYGLLLFVLPFLTLPEIWRNKSMRCLLLISSSFLACIQLTTWFFPHYAAPGWPAWFVLLTFSIRTIRLWSFRGKPWGRMLVCISVFSCLFYCIVEHAIAPWLAPQTWADRKQEMSRELLVMDKKHLVLVQYDADHDPNTEWVFNSPTLDSQAIIWARSMKDDDNSKLVNCYPGRRVWLLRVNGKQPASTPLPVPYTTVP